MPKTPTGPKRPSPPKSTKSPRKPPDGPIARGVAIMRKATGQATTKPSEENKHAWGKRGFKTQSRPSKDNKAAWAKMDPKLKP